MKTTREPKGERRKREYRMTARREAMERTRVAILGAAFELWPERPYDEVTVDEIAKRAGVTRQTVVRRFGSKDRLALAVVDWHRPREASLREVPAGDVEEAVRVLVDRYELMGDANVRSLEMESRVPEMKYALAAGRRTHRAWIEAVFAEWLDPLPEGERERLVLALYAATDVMTWKLLRRDFGESREVVEGTMAMTIAALLESGRGAS